MTFDEGVRFKLAFKTGKIVFDGHEYHIFVVPGHGDDFQRYCHHYRETVTTDESARDFSSDQKFQLMALYRNEKTVQYKKIG